MQFGLADNRNIQEYGELPSLRLHNPTSLHLFPRPRLDPLPLRRQCLSEGFQAGVLFRCVFNPEKGAERNPTAVPGEPVFRQGSCAETVLQAAVREQLAANGPGSLELGL